VTKYITCEDQIKRLYFKGIGELVFSTFQASEKARVLATKLEATQQKKVRKAVKEPAFISKAM